MSIIFLFLTFSLLIFKNSLYFTIMLLFVSIITLIYLVLNTYIASLTAFIMVIVYVGAIMVLIGYICAVSPNLLLEPDYQWIKYSLFMRVSIALIDKFSYPQFNSTIFTIVDYFYSLQGIFVFMSLVFILFFTLLMVTSQYSLPQGPLRSL